MNSALLGHYVLTLYRTLTRQRLYAALNVLGLALGVAVFLVLMLDVRFETSFDRWIPQAANTYRLNSTRIDPGLATIHTANSMGIIAPLLAADYPQISAVARVARADATVSVGDAVHHETIHHVDANFFQVLALPLVAGDPSTALSSAGYIVISQKMATKYFGSQHVIGRLLTTIEDGVPIAHRVSAVLRELPANTDLKFDILEPMTPAFEAGDGFGSWQRVSAVTYLRFRSAADARAVQADLPDFLNRRAKGDPETKLGPDPTRELRLELVPLPALHFRNATTQGASGGADSRVVASVGLVGALTLIIAVLNYVNLATAGAALRAREVAVRKVLGATRRVLAIQFLAEALAVALSAVLIGVALAELALPAVNAAEGTTLGLTYLRSGGVAPLLLGLAVAIGLCAGAYPAGLLSGFQPAAVLAAAQTPGGGQLARTVRSALVLLQFAIAVVFTVASLTIGAQARFIRDADRGFRSEGLILVESLRDKAVFNQQGALMDALRATPGVDAATVSDRKPGASPRSFTKVEGRGTSAGVIVQYETIGRDYLATYGATIATGRRLDTEHGGDDIAGLDGETLMRRGYDVAINQSALAALGFPTPRAAIGQTLHAPAPVTIVGVVRDVRFASPREPVDPLVYVFDSRSIDGGVAAVRFHGVEPRVMMARLANAWRRVAPGDPFVARTAEAELADYYVPEAQRGRLFGIAAGLAVVIACLGLYGLAAFTTARRVREIGIRKTLGASSAQVLRLLVGQFLRPVLLANLVAWPLAWLAMRSWLAGFDQRIELSPLYFLAATALTLVIAVATVAGQAFAVARSEPAKALRDE